jgi:putative FmdB family regulatory protein
VSPRNESRTTRSDVAVPTYQYVCTNAEDKHEFEVVQSFSDPSLTECPQCGSPVRKVYGSVGVVFKGSGFYRTDSRAGAKSGDGGSSNGTPAAAGAAKESGGGSSSSGGSSEGTKGGSSSSGSSGGTSGSSTATSGSKTG